MSSMTPLIGRNANRFNPIVGRARDVVGERRATKRSNEIVVADDAPGATPDLLRFLTAFAGGFVFFSVLIF